MNLNIEKPKFSKSKINFPKIRRSLQTILDLLVIIPPPNTIWDHESFGYGNRMAIIGETPLRYVTMDPSNFDNVANQFDSSNGDKILELDKIPYYARSIKQVLSDKEKL